MRRFAFIPFACAAVMSLAAPADAQTPHAYQLDLTITWEEGAPGDCDGLYFDNPETIYTPVAPNGPPCSQPGQPVNGVLNSLVTCDFDPIWYSSQVIDLQLWTGGTGRIHVQTEDEYGRFLCVLQYDVEVTQLY